jgi:catechol 2,3-dioxygenase-like lactoylglutathione lyase family enzyme
MLCKKMHHVAYRCRDARETADFYTNVLGLKFAHVMGEDHVPSTGRYSPHIHLFFELEDRSNIAFFEVPKDPGNVRDMESPDWIQHIAFEVQDVPTLYAAKKDLEAKGVDVLGPTDHDGFMLSIYFRDPSGHRLELTTCIADPEQVAKFETQAPHALSVWEQTHDWSQRDKAFSRA